VLIENASSNQIEENLIAGNQGHGVEIRIGSGSTDAAQGNLLRANQIGVDLTGTAALRNEGHGVFINGRETNPTGVAGNVVEANTIAGNLLNGITIDNAAPALP
jgi:nitrous oxidase accessory protein NosD